jgi:protein-S-isoprenylcysteine O-methyltransferase Ste14
MLSRGVHLDGLNDSAGVKFPPPLLYVAFLGLGILASFWYPVYLLPSALAWTLGWAILAGGVVLGPIWGVPTLHKAGTTMRPDKPTAKLVTDGPFRFSRNPLYLALTLMYAGMALIANSIWALLLLFPVTLIMSRFVIRREEEYLARTFGEEYQHYKMTVRRWI